MNFERIPPLWLDETDSTNAEAMRLLKRSKPAEGTCIAAQFQTEGRGQRSNAWSSRPRENLLVSFILYPPLAISGAPFLLSKTAALAVRETLQHFTTEEVHIKWPNDVLIGRKKAAGILIENQWMGSQWHAAVVGIGLNVNQTIFSVEHATSLRASGADALAPETVLTELQTRLSHHYHRLCKGESQAISGQYHDRLFGKENNHSYETLEGPIEAKVLRVLDDGRIEMVTGQGNTRLYDLSELRLIY
ncbi:MAG: biotin--[acetyl-CoA-carboxylase] ligase [Flavobacteriales bacterium]|jgi:BirA family biotin operon repressor/biotin-[acetyl-CoA-carboxylase] ligase